MEGARRLDLPVPLNENQYPLKTDLIPSAVLLSAESLIEPMRPHPPEASANEYLVLLLQAGQASDPRAASPPLSCFVPTETLKVVGMLS